jgi:hypothetical protein
VKPEDGGFGGDATFLEHLAVNQDEEEEERTWTSDSEADSTPSRTENDFTSDSE